LNDKQKDDIEADAIYIQPRTDTGTSLVFEKAEAPEKAKRGEGPPKPLDKAGMLAVLAQHGTEGLTWKEWLLASRVPKMTFIKRIKRLTEENEIYKDDSRYYIYPATEDIAGVDDDDE
jgi:hypothetical protein